MTDAKHLFDTIRTIAGRPLKQAEVDAINAALAPGNRRQINAAGLDIIKRSEGLRLTAYEDAVGVLTIGYGHTGPDVRKGLTISQERAEELLRDDVAEAEAAVAQLAPVTTENQYAALVSFTFNLGATRLANSTLLRDHNSVRYADAQARFADWVFAGGRVLPGLVTRRKAEAALYGKAG